MSLYGLKQASRQLNKTLTAQLREMKFEQCPVDLCLMRLIIDGEIVALVVMHVDILTKPPGRGGFELHRDFLLGRGS